MLMPKRTKYRRVQRGRMKGAASRGNKVSYGEFGIQAMEPGWITGVRMGSGKGAPEYWVAVVKNQKVMFEIGGVSEAEAREALRLAQHKLPIKTKIIAKEAPETENGGE